MKNICDTECFAPASLKNPDKNVYGNRIRHVESLFGIFL